MKTFEYRAARADGILVKGVVPALSVGEAVTRLTGRGLYPITVQVSPPPRARGAGSAADIAVLLRGLATLTAAGVPLQKALQVSRGAAPARMRGALERVEERIREGRSFAGALEEEPLVFSRVTTGLVRAAERGLGLTVALDLAATQTERTAEVRSRVQNALTYPVVLSVVGTASLVMIMLVIVPRFVPLFASAGSAVPPLAGALMAASAWLRNYWLPLAAAAASVAGGSGLLMAQYRGVWSRHLLRMPVIGSIRYGLAGARAARALGALLAAGSPTLLALAAAQDAAGDPGLDDRFERAREQVAQGTRLSEALGQSHAFTPLLRQLTALGEDAGRVPDLLLRGAEMEERGAERRLRVAVSLLEPALILAFAAVTALVAGALLQAVYGLRVN